MNTSEAADRRTEPGWAQAVRAVLAAMRSGAFSPGDLAALRREHPEAPESPSFWRALAVYVEPLWPLPREPEAREHAETAWAVILSNMARLPEAGAHPATVLARTGYAELRFLRLLRSRGAERARQVRAAVAFLSSKGVGFDWVPLAELLLADPERSPEWAERVRRDFARRFFNTLFESQNAST